MIHTLSLLHILSLLCVFQTATSDTLRPWTENYVNFFNDYGLFASDPSVIKINNSFYRMFYTCNDFPYGQYPDGTLQICQATSTTGEIMSYANVNTIGGHNQSAYVVSGIAIQSRDGNWDENCEVAAALTDPSIATKLGSDHQMLVYYSGYTNTSSRGIRGYPANLGLTYSSDGLIFHRHIDGPVMTGTPGGWDSDAIYSVTLLFDPTNHDRILMLYAGHCYWNCAHKIGANILGAYSTNFVNWTKIPDPVINITAFDTSVYSWMFPDGIAEPGWIYGSDGYFYLFITGNLGDTRQKRIYLARSTSPFANYTVFSDPIIYGDSTVASQGILAPSVLVEGNQVRMWMLVYPILQGDYFHWFQISEANTTWPLVIPSSSTSSSSISTATSTTKSSSTTSNPTPVPTQKPTPTPTPKSTTTTSKLPISSASTTKLETPVSLIGFLVACFSIALGW